MTISTMHVLIAALFISSTPAVSMQVRRTWTTKHWCESVVDPEWPFAYSKFKNQKEERKGRVLSNLQDVRHECETRGVRSKCHICEDIQCGTRNSGDNASWPAVCHFQLQGVSTDEMSKNIPTVSDVPWAVGGSHRYDYGGVNTSHVCMHMSGGSCQSNFATDYSRCELRCWGHSSELRGVDNEAGDATIVAGEGTGRWPNARVDYLDGVSMTPWTRPAPTQTWSYPKQRENETIGNPRNNESLRSMSQGLTFTLAGDIKGGEAGFRDGVGFYARFRHPEGVAVDHMGYVFVADTGNHAVRMISPFGNVTTIAGNGRPGFANGILPNIIQFNNPSSLTVWRDWEWWPYPHPVYPHSSLYRNGNGTLTVFVADTGNHQIRKIVLDVIDEVETLQREIINVSVECFSGSCHTESHEKQPRPGYSDGSKYQARFDSPRGLAVGDDGDVFVADTNNHLIRKINKFGNTVTIAGTTQISERNAAGEPLEGCPEPCLAGVQGHADGSALKSKFSFPTDLELSADKKSILVTDQHYVRSINLAGNSVHTLAGSERESERDGFGSEAAFNKPAGLTVTVEGYIYVIDSASCRIRRAFYTGDILANATCSDTLSSLFRPAGCSSYNAESDLFGMKASPVSQNIYYNYRYRKNTSDVLGEDSVGRGIKDCVGSPPLRKLSKRNYSKEESLVVNDYTVDSREDPNEGSLLTVSCPSKCDAHIPSNEMYTDFADIIDSTKYIYTESTPICAAAIHSGVHRKEGGGMVDVMIHKADVNYINPDFFGDSNSFGIGQFYSVMTSSSDLAVHTISGAPTRMIESSCGRRDSIPPQGAMFSTPVGISAFPNSTLDNLNNFLYIADRDNNAIRVISAACSFPCENDGRCIGPDQCECKSGWHGIDCTRPKCSRQCGERQLCVAPDQCMCIPGWKGDNCTEATCVQPCNHGGSCSAPDTCSCLAGWFDTNCTTPVCQQTCGNGGNCTAPDKCSCPTDWKGNDCRTPVCEQHCQNGGSCIAPNTCQCPPEWSGFDCSQPVCHQGYFEPFSSESNTSFRHWLEYRPCNLTAWCVHTNVFECYQKLKNMENAIPLHGQKWRQKTGRKHVNQECVAIELLPDIVSWFQYQQSWDGKETPYMRYSVPTPFNWSSFTQEAWNAKIFPDLGFSSPWTYDIDRQVATVKLFNVTQGRYRCANEGSCVAPDTCACAKGWMGFDCRVPICEQGYYEKDQPTFVKGANDNQELEIFEKFMSQNQTYRLDPAGYGYSNPTYQRTVERFLNSTFVMRYEVKKGGKRYLHQSGNNQGGYRCSIRAVTEWEDYRSGRLFEHPNFFSRYMDRKVEEDGSLYTHWTAMGWEPTYAKSAPLEVHSTEFMSTNGTKRIFVYTDEGYKRQGEWSKTLSNWTKGRCIIEFRRVCDDSIEAYDLEGRIKNEQKGSTLQLVQDTDLSYRPRLNYDDNHAYLTGVWKGGDGMCTDHVIRGCFNNGTCVAPNQCECAKGWEGFDCTTPICAQKCLHNGNCTMPDICTCERGWKGGDCSIPICSQDCNNGGTCIAPDTCRCHQWKNTWRDGRKAGGVPLFQTSTGEPQLTGWTGYDCSTPICVQAETFILNVNISSYARKDLIPLGGHGKDGKLPCDGVKCPEYDSMVVVNNGRSFQSGCGNDPLITGCCSKMESLNGDIFFKCFKCRKEGIIEFPRSTRCHPQALVSWTYDYIKDIPSMFKVRGGETLILCGQVHNPGKLDGTEYYISDDPFATPYWSNRNYESTLTSDKYLCNRHEWTQGDYLDNAGLQEERGIGADFGLREGRHTRVNFNNYVYDDTAKKWKEGNIIEGEGIFACYNSGSCIAPDVCTCKDGYSGFDCKTPLCRHRQLDGTVVGCLNGGICRDKDICECATTESILWMKYGDADRGLTGWNGDDCSTPICLQGYYDPLCDDNPQAKGGQGCYRCFNGGLCIAPDVCECSEGWTGYDCQTPVCEAAATQLIKKQLMTSDEDKIRIFERDPCAMNGFDSRLVPESIKQTRGKCTMPNQCTCFCNDRYDASLCRFLGGKFCINPFQDYLYKYRNVLAPNEIFGTRSCNSGFEGAVDEKDKFISCHLNIYEPTYFVKNSTTILCWTSFFFLIIIWISICIKRQRHSNYMSKKYEKRRFRREGMAPTKHAFAFGSTNKRKKTQ